MSELNPDPRCDSRPSGETLPGRVLEWARLQPESLAILDGEGGLVSYGFLRDEIGRISGRLIELGIRPGDRVAVLARLGVDSAIVILAAMSGTACLPLNPTASPAEWNAMILRTGVRILLVPDSATHAEREQLKTVSVPALHWPSGTCDGRAADGTGPAPVPGDGDSQLALLLRTSGSTGDPRIVGLTHRQLLARCERAAQLFGLTRRDRCLNPAPLSYAHGLTTGLFTPLVSGGSTICPPGFARTSFLSAIRNAAPTWYTSGATFHQTILDWIRRDPGSVAGHRLRFVRSGSSRLPDEQRRELSRLLGVPVVVTYSSSEAGIMAATPMDGAMPAGAVGRSVDGNIKITDRAGTSLSPGCPGEIRVRGPGVVDRYWGDDGDARFPAGWHRTGDIGYLDTDGFLFLQGRVDDVINRGGEKIDPEEIERAIHGFPGIAQAVVFALPHATLGSDIMAVVVPASGRVVEEDRLRDFLFDRLSAFKVPRRILSVGGLPLGPTGKPLRSRMADHFAGQLAGAPASEQSANLTDDMAVLARLYGRILGVDVISPDSDFFLLGGDSLSAVRLIALAEREYGLKITLDALVRHSRISALAAWLANEDGSEGEVIAVHPNGDRTPLFGIAGRHGHPLRLVMLARQFDAEQPFYGLRPPGMDWHRRGIGTLEEMARHYVDQLRGIQAKGPYQLLGISIGGLMVFEMARQLEALGKEVAFLGMVDTFPTTFDLRKRRREFRSTTPVGKLAPDATEDEKRALTVAAQHIQARLAYEIRTPVRCPITFYLNTGGGVLPGEDRRRYWRWMTTGAIRWIPMPGPHAEIDREPMFSQLAASVRCELEGQPGPAKTTLEVFAPGYRLVEDGERELVCDRGGNRLEVRRHRTCELYRLRRRAATAYFKGWASDASGRKGLGRILVFLGPKCIAYASCDRERKDVVEATGEAGLRYCGFLFRVKLPADPASRRRLIRLFVLDEDAGLALELQPTVWTRGSRLRPLRRLLFGSR